MLAPTLASAGIPIHHGDRGGDTMAARKSSRVNRKYKTKYRLRNWREYERCPSSILIWPGSLGMKIIREAPGLH